MNATIRTYRQVSDNMISVDVVSCTVKHIEKVFKRYIKTYVLAYGKKPGVGLLELELGQFTGVNLADLIRWSNEC